MAEYVPCNISKPVEDKPIHAFEVRDFTNHQFAAIAMNDPYHIPFKEDPIGYISRSNATELASILERTSHTSTCQYVRWFVHTMTYMVWFEEKALWAYLRNANYEQRVAISLIYLIENKEIDTTIFTPLNEIIKNCPYESAKKVHSLLIKSGVTWDDGTLDDPIFQDFMRKVDFSPTPLKLVVNQ